MRVSIDAGKCQGHGRCCLRSRAVFDMDDAGKGVVLQEYPAEELRAAVKAAEAGCPEQAITVSEE